MYFLDIPTYPGNICAPMCPTVANVYLCPNVGTFSMCPAFTNVYVCPNLPHYSDVPQFSKCMFVPQCVPLPKCAPNLQMYISAAMCPNFTSIYLYLNVLYGRRVTSDGRTSDLEIGDYRTSNSKSPF